MAGPIATSAFNRLCQYASSPGTGPLLCRTHRFFSSGDLDHHQYSLCHTHGGMARLSRPGWLWLNTKMVYPRMVTHPSTNRAQRRATTLIETNALPLRQAATIINITNKNCCKCDSQTMRITEYHVRCIYSSILINVYRQ